MVTRILRLDAPPKPADAADALALAITHIWRGGAQARIDAALAAAGKEDVDDRVRPRPGRRRHPVQRRARGRRRRPRAACARPARWPRCGTGQTATLPTSMVVREDSLTLFGFVDEDEKPIFELVQTASGVGPKLAQAMLAVLAPDDLRRAIAADDVKTLTRVPGHRPEGRAADHPRAQGPDRRPGRRRAGAAAAAAAPWRDQVAPGPGRPRLVGARTPSRPSTRSPTEAGRQPRRRRAAARRPPQRCRRPDAWRCTRTSSTAAEEAHLRLAHRGRGRRRRARGRGGAAAAHPRRGDRPEPGPRPARPGPRGGPAPRPGARPRAAVRARPASARPRWR